MNERKRWKHLSLCDKHERLIEYEVVDIVAESLVVRRVMMVIVADVVTGAGQPSNLVISDPSRGNQHTYDHNRSFSSEEFIYLQFKSYASVCTF